MIKKLEYSVANYDMARNSPNKDIPTTVWWEDMCRIKEKINEIIDHLPQEKKPYQPPKSNHLEVNYIAVGYYKHEIDFGVLGSVQELSDTDFEKMLDMLQTAIRVAKEMRAKKQPTKEVPELVHLFQNFTREDPTGTYYYIHGKDFIKLAQEISALYRKDK